MALDPAASERKKCDSRRGKENSPILHSVKFLVFGRGCSKKKGLKCAQFLNAFTALQARGEQLQITFTSNRNNEFIKKTVWFKFLNN